jgi:allantoicase
MGETYGRQARDLMQGRGAEMMSGQWNGHRRAGTGNTLSALLLLTRRARVEELYQTIQKVLKG